MVEYLYYADCSFIHAFVHNHNKIVSTFPAFHFASFPQQEDLKRKWKRKENGWKNEITCWCS